MSGSCSFEQERTLVRITETKGQRKLRRARQGEALVGRNSLAKLFQIDLKLGEFCCVLELRWWRPVFPYRSVPGRKQFFRKRFCRVDRLVERLHRAFPFRFEGWPLLLIVGRRFSFSGLASLG